MRRPGETIIIKNKLSILALISLCALLVGMAACGRTVSNGLMAGASPSTSALELNRYDGEKLARGNGFRP